MLPYLITILQNSSSRFDVEDNIKSAQDLFLRHGSVLRINLLQKLDNFHNKSKEKRIMQLTWQHRLPQRRNARRRRKRRAQNREFVHAQLLPHQLQERFFQKFLLSFRVKNSEFKVEFSGFVGFAGFEEVYYVFGGAGGAFEEKTHGLLD